MPKEKTTSFAVQISKKLEAAVKDVKKDLDKVLNECLQDEARTARKQNSAEKKLTSALEKKELFTEKVKLKNTAASKTQLERAKLAVLTTKKEIESHKENKK